MYKKGVILFSLSLFLGFFLVSLFNSTSSVSNAENQVGENLKKKMPNLKRKTPKKSIMLSYSENSEDSNVVVNVVRSEDEWQGMLAPAFHPPCREDSDCGLAMACLDNICSACVEDGDCDVGESVSD